MRNITRFVFSVALITLTTGCFFRRQFQNAEFDQLLGRGPVAIVPTDEAAASTAFFRHYWTSSATIKHLVAQRGTPEAISVEREFLKPHRLKLYYPAQGQVYLLDQVSGEWLVSGSEPLRQNELELVALQRERAAQTNQHMVQSIVQPVTQVAAQPVAAVALPSSGVAPINSVAQAASTVKPPANIEPPPVPVAAIGSSEQFRGMLKPPSKARVATLTKSSRDTYLHTVTFTTEDLVILADWYTENPTNAASLARSNKRSVKAALIPGQRIAIPRNLMRNPQPLPESMVP